MKELKTHLSKALLLPWLNTVALAIIWTLIDFSTCSCHLQWEAHQMNLRPLSFGTYRYVSGSVWEKKRNMQEKKRLGIVTKNNYIKLSGVRNGWICNYVAELKTYVGLWFVLDNRQPLLSLREQNVYPGVWRHSYCPKYTRHSCMQFSCIVPDCGTTL